MTDDYEVQAYTFAGKATTPEVFKRKEHARSGYADNFAKDAASERAGEIMKLGFAFVGHESSFEDMVYERVDRVVIRPAREKKA